jgi:hypothetical protein
MQCCYVCRRNLLLLFYAGRTVRPKCEQEVAAYKLERSKHINRDPALGKRLAGCSSSSTQYSSSYDHC